MTTSGKSTTEDWRSAALTLIQSESTLTLATAGPSGPWSAPVYYVWVDDRFCFFFLTGKPPYPAGHCGRKGGGLAVSPGGYVAGPFAAFNWWEPFSGFNLFLCRWKRSGTYLKRFPLYP